MKFLSICKASVAIAAAITSLVLVACETTPPNTTEETLRQRVSVPCPTGGQAEFESERNRKFKVQPGLVDPGEDGTPPPNYVPYGCYPLGNSGIEVCMYIDPNNPGKPWLVRPAGQLGPFWKLAPDRRAPEPNAPGYEGPDLSKHEGIKIDCMTWEEYTSATAEGTLQVGWSEIPSQGDTPDQLGMRLAFVNGATISMPNPDEFGVSVLIDGESAATQANAVIPAGAWVTIGGPVEGVAAFAANIGVESVTATVNGRSNVKLQSGDLWPFAAVLTQNHRGAWQIRDWIVLDSNWSW